MSVKKIISFLSGLETNSGMKENDIRTTSDKTRQTQKHRAENEKNERKSHHILFKVVDSQFCIHFE